MTHLHSAPPLVLPRWDLRRATIRFALATAAGGLTVALFHSSAPWYVRSVLGWDVAAAVLIVLSWSIIYRASPEDTRRRAAAEDAGRFVVWALAVAASLFSFFAATVVLRRAHGFPHGEAALWTPLTLAAIPLSWFLTHTAYTLRYAHLYYRFRDGVTAGGLKFPDDQEAPRDLDFAYFSFTLGMCFQVSDVSITSSTIRSEVLVHALLSFVYNTTIVALTLNLISGLFG